MEKCKYIVVEIFSGACNMETPIVFPEYIGHDDIVRQMGFEPAEVLSAGFVEIYPKRDYQIGVKAYGESISLGVGSRETDATMIRKALGIAEDQKWGSS